MTAIRKDRIARPPQLTEYPDPLMMPTDEAAFAADAVDKANAGARLTYAIYMHPAARELFASPLMTPALRKAYLAAARLWGL